MLILTDLRFPMNDDFVDATFPTGVPFSETAKEKIFHFVSSLNRIFRERAVLSTTRKLVIPAAKPLVCESVLVDLNPPIALEESIDRVYRYRLGSVLEYRQG